MISERKLKIYAGMKSSEISKYIDKSEQTLTLKLTSSEWGFTWRKNLNIESKNVQDETGESRVGR